MALRSRLAPPRAALPKELPIASAPPARAPAPASPAAPPDEPRTKPRLRGVSHLLALLAFAPAALWLVWRARSGPVAVGTSVYAASVVLVFATSSLYHCLHWEQPARGLLGRLDHAAIFGLIAGSFTPFGLRIGGLLGTLSLAGLWLGALTGIALVMRPQGVGKKARAAIYVGLGWAMVPLAPALLTLLGWRGICLLVSGGVFYTLGAVIYALRRPDPFPRTFGFHEIFHLLVIAAAACHFAAVAGVAL